MEFESKDLRCAKAALQYPSVSLSVGRPVSRNCRRRAHGDQSRSVAGEVAANFPHTCGVERGRVAFRHFPVQVFAGSISSPHQDAALPGARFHRTDEASGTSPGHGQPASLGFAGFSSPQPASTFQPKEGGQNVMVKPLPTTRKSAYQDEGARSFPTIPFQVCWLASRRREGGKSEGQSLQLVTEKHTQL